MNKLLPHEERLLKESAELTTRLNALTAFINTPVFAALSAREQALLLMQAHCMAGYADVLVKRLDIIMKAINHESH